MTPIRVRMAPSPTGLFHIGSARTTLFNYLFARHYGGQFVLRIEDTDPTRSKPEFVDNILASLNWLGLEFDEGPQKGGEFAPYFQSERMHFHKEFAKRLIDQGNAYYCYCTPEELELERVEQSRQKLPPKYSGRCRHLTEAQKSAFESEGRARALRFIVPDEEIVFDDLIKGTIKVNAATYGDLVLVKPDGMATYNFACVVDDHLMQISHVLRGEDHISNTPKQVLLYQALGLPLPHFGHIPLILNQDRSKMSKRSGPVAVMDYREGGYLPVAVTNFLALLGWSPGDDRELFTLAELVEAFTIEKVQSSPAIFNLDKLNWFNGQHIRRLSTPELWSAVQPFLPALGPDDVSTLQAAVPLVSERMTTLKEFWQYADFFVSNISYEDGLKPKGLSVDQAVQVLQSLLTRLTALESWNAALIENELRTIVEQSGFKTGEIFMMVRIAVTGRKASPPLFETMVVIGKEHTLERLQKAVETLPTLG